MTVLAQKTYVVYVATNVVNGHRYIGATSCGLDSRKAAHVCDAKSGRGGCRVFHGAILKYGDHSFEWRIIATLETFEQMMTKEVELIAELKPEYNMTRGGEGIVGLVRTKEWKDKVILKLKGRKLSRERVEAMRVRDKSYQYKPVVCLNDGRFFESVKSARSFYGVGDISGCFRGEQQTVSGLYFVFSSKKLSDEECSQKLHESREKSKQLLIERGKKRRRPVICITDNNKRFDGLVSAARYYSIDQNSIVASCKKGAIVKEKLVFRYEDQKELPVRFIDTEQGRKQHRQGVLRALAKGRQKLMKSVIAVETGEIFDSVTNVAKTFNVDLSKLYYFIDKGGVHPQVGLTFKKLENSHN